MHDNIENVETQSPDLALERQQQLRELFPEAWSESGLDFAKLRTLLGDLTDDNPERYRFGWAGKREALQLLQTRSHATLVPDGESSVDFENSRNWFIEGDNLEVLKLLYKPLFGRVKMIYIDPPYNTGNDFIYPDNFSDPLQNYLIQTGQKDANGDSQTSAPDTAGRVHSNWLSMLLPRLTLARSLLRDNGVIFVSIDDNEVHHLRLLMNEVFGEENFIGQLVWEKGRKNDAKLFSLGHEYMLVFARSLATLKELKTIWREEKPGAREIMDKTRELFGHEEATEETVQKSLRTWFSALPNNHSSKKLSRYKNIDKHGLKHGPWRDHDISWPGGGGPRYDVIHPVTQKPCAVPKDGWRYSKPEKMDEQIKLGLVEFREDETQPPFRKRHLVPIAEELVDESEDKDDDEIEDDGVEGSETEEEEEEEEEDDESVGMQVVSSVIYKQSQVAVKYLRELMGAKVFDNPKDHEVLKRLIRYCTAAKENHIVLDFFAGSGSTGEAVLQANREDNGNRRFVCVQLPETTRKLLKNGKYRETVASKAGFPTIADIATARITRVIERMKNADNSTLDVSTRETPEDLGFKAWKLKESHFRQMQPVEAGNTEAYLVQLELMNDALLPGSDARSVIYEIALREGFDLNCDIARVADLDGVAVWRVTDTERDQRFFISLDATLELEPLRPLKLTQDDWFICRSVALDDDTAANLTLQCRLKMV